MLDQGNKFHESKLESIKDLKEKQKARIKSLKTTLRQEKKAAMDLANTKVDEARQSLVSITKELADLTSEHNDTKRILRKVFQTATPTPTHVKNFIRD